MEVNALLEKIFTRFSFKDGELLDDDVEKSFTIELVINP